LVTVSLEAKVLDPAELRRLFADVAKHLGAFPLTEDSKVHLAKVVWELLTNGRHAQVDDNAIVCVSLFTSPLSVSIRLPGSTFDSVDQSAKAGATGLDTAAWLVKRCFWDWSHRYSSGYNEILLTERN
jgi:hypothetical protein